MSYYKILLETGKNRSDERLLYVNSNILEALSISKKIKNSSLKYIIPINKKAYMRGVSEKYD